MPKMTWKKSPEGLVSRFAEVVPDDPAVERRSMFGYPCAFLNGHMFCGLFQDHFILRLPEAGRATFLREPGSTIFEPMSGRPMKEYVVVPAAVLASDARLTPWLREARSYVATLPPKANKGAMAAKAAPPPKGRGPQAKTAPAATKAKKAAPKKATAAATAPKAPAAAAKRKPGAR
jgi:TfoX/Sxy family transcriptional regulator of competence genes